MKVTTKTYIIKTFSIKKGKEGPVSTCEHLQVINASWDNLKRYVYNIAKHRPTDDFRVDVENVTTDLTYRMLRNGDTITLYKLDPISVAADLEPTELKDTGEAEFTIPEKPEEPDYESPFNQGPDTRSFQSAHKLLLGHAISNGKSYSKS